ncbi:hypothetical protein JRI60_36600 [Archangium violaceum]|uniref:hypothetical protein n=1 Tax=Archangium violaceum TaxID=83451 RepID=UPI0019509647|nr:hypothetical protein [Archangium violaceum]QRN94607.1 hypothetical protein JRI60_36600 [Archangium violaceum]
MRRRALIILLAVGTIAGYSSGFASLYRWHRYGHGHGQGWSCQHGRGYEYDTRTAPSWPPPRQPPAPQAPQAQAQAPLTDAPGEPGPR